MRGGGGRVFGAVAIACAIIASASCSYGTYDGSAGDAASPGTLDIAFTPGAGVTRQTADRFLFVQIPPDAFAAPTTVHVTRLADRQTSLTFPVFQITADAPLTGRIALQFAGANNNNNNPNLDPFAIGRLDATGTFVPLPLVGLEQNVAWGVIAALGTFTVDRAPIRGYDRDGTAFRASCFDKCCSGANGGVNQNRNAAGTKNGCFCFGEQSGGLEAAIDLQCFLACADTKGEGARCAGRAFVEGNIECGGAGVAGSTMGCPMGHLGGPLNGTPPCCLQSGQMGMTNNICGLSGCNNPTGPIRRCGGKSNCPDGECCLFTEDNEYRCAATCPGQKL